MKKSILFVLLAILLVFGVAFGEEVTVELTEDNIVINGMTIENSKLQYLINR